MTVLVVDGYNAINAVPETRQLAGEDLHEARKEIIRISKEYARSSGYITDVRVVFDGDDRYRYLDALEVPRGKTMIFSGTGEGDDKIIEVVKKCSRKARVIIASNDNYVRNMARGYKATPLNVQELSFMKRKNKKNKAHKRITQDIKNKINEEYRKELGIK